MRNLKRAKPGSGTWGVVNLAIRADGEPTLWMAHWMLLRPPFTTSIEIDRDPEQNISHAAWRRARKAFGVPARIVVLDEETAAQVRRVVSPRIAVEVKEEPRLRDLVDACLEAERENEASAARAWPGRPRDGSRLPH